MEIRFSFEDLSMDIWRKFYYSCTKTRNSNPWETFFLPRWLLKRNDGRYAIDFFSLFWKISSENFQGLGRESRRFCFATTRPSRSQCYRVTDRCDLNRIRQLIRSKMYVERLNGDSFCLFAFTVLFVYVSLLFVFAPSAYVSTHRVFRTPNSLTPF